MSYKVQKACRICGKLYIPCSDCENDKNAFHWRTVACSRECAMKYFAKIEKTRSTKIEISTFKENDNNVFDKQSPEAVIEENPKPKRIKKKNIEESEQID